MYDSIVRRIEHRRWVVIPPFLIGVCGIAACVIGEAGWVPLVVILVVTGVGMQIARALFVSCRYCGGPLRTRDADMPFEQLVYARDQKLITRGRGAHLLRTGQTFGWKPKIQQCQHCRRLEIKAVKNTSFSRASEIG